MEWPGYIRCRMGHVTGLFACGASAWFALQSRSSKQFINERFKRLLIPFIVAFIVLSPFQAYIMSYFIASGYSHYQGDLLQFFTYFFEHIRIGGDLKFLTIYGYHLWFLAFLYIISMMALPVLMYLKQARGSRIIIWLVPSALSCRTFHFCPSNCAYPHSIVGALSRISRLGRFLLLVHYLRVRIHPLCQQ